MKKKLFTLLRKVYTDMRKDGLNFEISGGLLEALYILADRNGTDVLIELKRAISDRYFFSKKVSEGNVITIQSPDKPKVLVNWR